MSPDMKMQSINVNAILKIVPLIVALILIQIILANSNEISKYNSAKSFLRDAFAEVEVMLEDKNYLLNMSLDGFAAAKKRKQLVKLFSINQDIYAMPLAQVVPEKVFIFSKAYVFRKGIFSPKIALNIRMDGQIEELILGGVKENNFFKNMLAKIFTKSEKAAEKQVKEIKSFNNCATQLRNCLKMCKMYSSASPEGASCSNECYSIEQKCILSR